MIEKQSEREVQYLIIALFKIQASLNTSSFLNFSGALQTFVW